MVYDPDRLSRNLTNQLIIADEIEKCGAKLDFVTGSFDASPEGRLFFAMRGAISEYEKAKIRERTMRGMKRKVITGNLVGRREMFGYDWDTETKNYVVNEAQAEIIRLIYSLIIDQGHGVRRIAVFLNEAGIKPLKADRWATSTVYRVLTNESYYGTHYSFKLKHFTKSANARSYTRNEQENWVGVDVPSIISKETFDAAQDRLQRNKEDNPRNLSRNYLFRPYLYCGKCGRKLYIMQVANRRYYRCGSKDSIDRPACDARYIPIATLEKDLYAQFKSLKIKDIILSNIQVEDPGKELDRQEKKLLEQRDTLLYWFDKNLQPREKINPRLEAIKEQLDQLAEKRKELMEKKAVPRNTAKQIITALQNDLEGSLKEVVDKIFVVRTDPGKKQLTVELGIRWK